MNKVLPIKDLETIKKIKRYYTKNKIYREYLLFLLSLNTGLRITDILSLKVKHVKDKKELVYKDPSTKIVKKFPLNRQIREIAEKVVGSRKDNDWLFISVTGKKLERTLIYRKFKAVCKELGLSKKYSVASLRKSFGWHYYEQYNDLSYLAYIFDQNSIHDTINYLGIKEDLNKRFQKEFKL